LKKRNPRKGLPRNPKRSPGARRGAYAVSPGIRALVSKRLLSKEEVDHLIAEHRKDRDPGAYSHRFTTEDLVLHVSTNEEGVTWIETDSEYQSRRN